VIAQKIKYVMSKLKNAISLKEDVVFAICLTAFVGVDK
jgi:hypothetical protein